MRISTARSCALSTCCASRLAASNGLAVATIRPPGTQTPQDFTTRSVRPVPSTQVRKRHYDHGAAMATGASAEMTAVERAPAILLWFPGQAGSTGGGGIDVAPRIGRLLS